MLNDETKVAWVFWGGFVQKAEYALFKRPCFEVPGSTKISWLVLTALQSI